MKKFLIKLLVFITVCIALPIYFCVAIDPYNVFHADDIRFNEFEPNKNYIKTKYIIENPNKFDSFIFGSSRVGTLHTESGWSEKCYNMTYSEGLPLETLNNLKTFINNGVIPEKVYLGVDSLSYTLDPNEHLSKGINAPYEYSITNPIDFWSLYLDPAVVWEGVQSVVTSENEHDPYMAEVFYEYGWNIDYNSDTTYDFNNAEPSVGRINRMEQTLEEIEQIVYLCEDNGIELVLFTNPMYYITYEASLDLGYIEFLEKLAKITPYYNFSGYNQLTIDSNNYVDSSHYKPEVGDLMREVLCYDAYLYPYHDQGFGVLIDESNVDQWLESLDYYREHFLETAINTK